MVVFRGGTARIEAVFTDFAGDPEDPTSQSIEIYEPDGSLVDTYTQASGNVDTTGTGTWYCDYQVPADAEYGRWLCLWTGTISGEDTPLPFGFIVADVSWPTEDELRDYLDDLSTDRVDPDNVWLQIWRAARRIERESSSGVAVQDKREAILACAGYTVYLNYATNVERMSGGRLPPAVENNLSRYRQECAYWAGVISGTSPEFSRGHVFGKQYQNLSLYDQDHKPGIRKRV